MARYSIGDGLPAVLAADGCHAALLNYFDDNRGIFEMIAKIVPADKRKIMKKRLSMKDRILEEKLSIISQLSLRDKINYFVVENGQHEYSLELNLIFFVLDELGLEEQDIIDPDIVLSKKYIWLDLIFSEAERSKIYINNPTTLLNCIESVYLFLDENNALSDEQIKLAAIAVFCLASWFDSALPIVGFIERYPESKPLFNGLLEYINRAAEALSFSGYKGVNDPGLGRAIERLQIEAAFIRCVEPMLKNKEQTISELLFCLSSLSEIAVVFSNRLTFLQKEESIHVMNYGIGFAEKIYDEYKTFLTVPFKERSIDPKFVSKKKAISAIISNASSLKEGSSLMKLCGMEYVNLNKINKELNEIGEQIRQITEKKECLLAKSGNDFPDMNKMNKLYDDYTQKSNLLIDTAASAFLDCFDDGAYSAEASKIKEGCDQISSQNQLMIDSVKGFASTSEPSGEIEENDLPPVDTKTVSSLKTELDELYEHHHLLEQTNKELEEKLRAELLKNAVLTDANDRMKSSSQTTNAISSADMDALRTVCATPHQATPEMLLTAYSILYPDRLVVLPSAYRSAIGSATFKHSKKLSSLLITLVTDYLDAINGGQPDAKARELLGSSYSAKESETVLSNQSLRSYREFNVEGETVLMIQHLIIGVADAVSETIRVYFKIIKGIVHIAYCGGHLPLRQ